MTLAVIETGKQRQDSGSALQLWQRELLQANVQGEGSPKTAPRGTRGKDMVTAGLTHILTVKLKSQGSIRESGGGLLKVLDLKH